MQSCAVLNALPVWVVLLNDDLTVRYVNTALAKVIGQTATELVGIPINKLGLDPIRYGDWMTLARRAITRHEQDEYVYRVTPSGPIYRFHFNPQRDTSTLVVTITQDRPTEPTSGEQFCRLMENVPVYAWLRDQTGRYRFVNNWYQQAVRPDVDWTGKLLQEVWPPDLAEQYAASDRAVIADGQLLEYLDTGPVSDSTNRTWYCTQFPLVMADEQRVVAGIAVDLTERLKIEGEQRRLERRLLTAQKLDSLGAMAGGVAHDFNNLLTTILGNASLARMNVSDPSPVSECLRKVESAAMRAAEVCQQMLAYSGRGQLVIKDVDLNALIRDSVTTHQSVVGQRVVVELHLAATIPPVRGDESQLRQVVQNLMTNAADAVRPNRRTITIRTGVRMIDTTFINQLPAAAQVTPGPHCFVEVTDTGMGMDQSTLTHIFDPFFTTKYAARGLGLCAVQGIVRGHQGFVQVESRLGQGSTFTVFLPVDPFPTPASNGHHRTVEQRGRRRTVLVIDDEEPYRLRARSLLERAGFTVLLATDGEDGLATFGNFFRQVVAVLLDPTVTKSGGVDTHHQLRRIDPSVRVIFLKRGGRQETDFAIESGTAEHLHKPFTADEFLSTVLRTVE